MRVVVQRVTSASVSVDGRVLGSIGTGLLVLLGVTHDDGPSQVEEMARKLYELRVLRDEQSCATTGASLLVVSQFTLYGDTRKGRRPSWTAAATGVAAGPVVEDVIASLRGRGAQVETGVFGADMAVELVNDGPVTLVLDT